MRKVGTVKDTGIPRGSKPNSESSLKRTTTNRAQGAALVTQLVTHECHVATPLANIRQNIIAFASTALLPRTFLCHIMATQRWVPNELLCVTAHCRQLIDRVDGKKPPLKYTSVTAELPVQSHLLIWPLSRGSLHRTAPGMDVPMRFLCLSKGLASHISSVCRQPSIRRRSTL